MKRTTNKIDHLEETEDLVRFAKALGHPTRLKILNYLENQSCCFTGDLLEVIPLAQSTISQHLKELKDAGLIQGEVNPPKIKYCIHQENWAQIKNILGQFLNKNPTENCC